jgi:hypothetical protein
VALHKTEEYKNRALSPAEAFLQQSDQSDSKPNRPSREAFTCEYTEDQIKAFAKPGWTTAQTIQEMRKRDIVPEGAPIRRSQKAVSTPAESIAQQAELPFWCDFQRGISNIIACSSIFGVRDKRVKRETFEKQKLFVVGRAEIEFNGVELRADDELVWLQLVHLARIHGITEWITFPPSRVLEAIGWANNNSYREILRDAIVRMASCSLMADNISTSDGVAGKLIKFVTDFEYFKPEGKKKGEIWRVKIDPAMAALYADNQFGRLDWGKYKHMGPRARRLFDYAVSHREPHPLRLETVQKLCRSDTLRMQHFRDMVQKDLAELNASGLVSEACFDENGNVKIVR